VKRYARTGRQPGLVRWTPRAGSIYLGDQKLPITVPRVRDRQQNREVALATYQQFQTPRRRFIRASARQLQRLLERRLEAETFVALVIAGKTFAEDGMVSVPWA
jgi:hypothetical protein